MISFRRLAVASTTATVVLVAVGGLVRATKSGLGCGTDWPHCGGRVIPIFGSQAVLIEYSHRLAALTVIVLIGALAVLGARRYRDEPRVKWAAIAAFGLVLGQAILGAIVVKLELDAISVVLHLATAMALLGLLVYVTIKAYALEGRLPPAADASMSRAAAIAAGSVLALLMVGSYVSGRDAGYVFPDWPLMNGRVVPDLGVDLYAIHFFHRALAAIVGVVVTVVAVRILRQRAARPIQARLAHVALGLFGVEILLGAANIWTKLNAAVVTLHLLTGALIWASLVGIAVVSRPGVTREEIAETVVRAEPAVEMAGR
jgi:heme a synthase